MKKIIVVILCLWFQPASAQNVLDIKAAIKLLEPLAAGSSTDVYVSVWRDGRVFIKLRTRADQDLRGSGNDLNGALRDLAAKSRINTQENTDLIKVLAPYLPGQ